MSCERVEIGVAIVTSHTFITKCQHSCRGEHDRLQEGTTLCHFPFPNGAIGLLLSFLPFSEWGLNWICEGTEYLQVLDLRMGAIIGLSFGEGLRI